ncbi:nucleoside deaminase [Jatrophihabitans sp. GAS493]|uniref:nucleoside deaminase n=1 Tax=Jatrophihabitans sp. GAS493 TaxID=1907575 RepID=UPI0012FE127B|nr:nucleoside deaminase [Jatrophihabitans sp. GAS493]
MNETELMGQALEQAREALAAGDHPYGAVIVSAAGTLAERNRVVTTTDPTAHSETMAIRTAAAQWGLTSTHGATMFTSFEPCPMCLGAIAESGITRLVIGGRRVLGEPPLGDYRVEALLELMGRTGDIAIEAGPLASEIAEFYAANS